MAHHNYSDERRALMSYNRDTQQNLNLAQFRAMMRSKGLRAKTVGNQLVIEARALATAIGDSRAED